MVRGFFGAGSPATQRSEVETSAALFAFAGDQHGGGVQIGGDAGRHSARAQPPFGFDAIVDQQGAATGAVARLDVCSLAPTIHEECRSI